MTSSKIHQLQSTYYIHRTYVQTLAQKYLLLKNNAMSLSILHSLLVLLYKKANKNQVKGLLENFYVSFKDSKS